MVDRKASDDDKTGAHEFYSFDLDHHHQKQERDQGFELELELEMRANRNEQEMNSMMVENGTSYSSSRNDCLDDLDGSDPELELDEPPKLMDTATGDDHDHDHESTLHQHMQGSGRTRARRTKDSRRHRQTQHMDDLEQDDDDDNYDDDEQEQLDPSTPFICATINDLCARHSREELEFLVGRIDWLTITDCYYSEKSSTLCMVIEVHQSK